MSEQTERGDDPDGGGDPDEEPTPTVQSGALREEEPGSAAAPHPAEVDREFGWRGYALLAVTFVAFVVSPLVVYLQPPQLSWYVTLVLFPLLPALGLGAVAVWATTRP